MAATRSTLLLILTSVLLFTLQCFCGRNLHFPPPTSQAFNDLLEALTIFKFDQYKPDEDTNFEILSEAATDINFKDTNLQLIPDVDDKVWPLLYNKDVVALTEKNFSDFMAKNKYVMVLFYAPWCFWSKRLAPEYGEAAKMLKGVAVLAMVDCSEEVELGRTNKIQAYPTMYFYVDGVRQNLNDDALERTRDAITTWVKRKMALAVHNITIMDEAIDTLNAESELVLGFLDSLEGPESEELAAASKLRSDINFYQTARADVAKLFHVDPDVKPPALILLQTVSRKFYGYHGQFTRVAIADFVSKIKHPPVITFTTENAGMIFQNPMKQLWLFAPKYDSEVVISTFEETAVAFREKLLFVHVEMNSGRIGNQIAHEFDITGDAPRVIAFRDRGAKKHELNGELSFSSIKSFAEDFLEEKLSSQSDPTSELLIKLPSYSRAPYQLHFPM